MHTNSEQPARTRMAPSPTGEYHLGNLRTALYDYALAKSTGGQFIVRIEDTDQNRFVEGSMDRILDVFADYGLNWDEGPRVGGPYDPYIQSERLKSGIYKDAALKLVELGNAYYCFCTKERLEEVKAIQAAKGKPPMYDRHCRALSESEVKEKLDSGTEYVIRLKVPDNEKIEYTDVVVGKVSWNSSILNDEVLIKSNGFPSYQLAVVIDDNDMKITHVFRGVEWISSTPKQILLYKYLGMEMPHFAHLSIILDPSGKGKMSKRKSGEIVFARYYLDHGYLKEAVLNYLMLLGWSPKEQKDFLTIEEFIKEFSLDRLQPQNPRFDPTKLDWFNGSYIRKLTIDELYERIVSWPSGIKDEALKEKASKMVEYFTKDSGKAKDILKLAQERLKKFVDLIDQVGFFYEKPTYTNEFLPKVNHANSEMIEPLVKLSISLKDIYNNGWVQESWESAVRSISDEYRWKAGDMFMLLRLAIVGSPYSPPLIDSMNLLGVDECIERINLFKTYIQNV